MSLLTSTVTLATAQTARLRNTVEQEDIFGVHKLGLFLMMSAIIVAT